MLRLISYLKPLKLVEVKTKLYELVFFDFGFYWVSML